MLEVLFGILIVVTAAIAYGVYILYKKVKTLHATMFQICEICELLQLQIDEVRTPKKDQLH